MRIKVSTKIVEKTNPQKTNYSHEIYSMILNNVSSETAKTLHSKTKGFKLLTFTNVCIFKDCLHFYVAGDEKLIQDFIKHIEFNRLMRVDDMVISLTNISQLPELQKRNEYIFKSNVIINVFNQDLKSTELTTDMNILKERLIKNSIAKANQYGISGNLNIDIINPKHRLTNYKRGHINSYRCNLKVSGDYDIINTIYNVGIGENTATGHGFLWEA